MRRLIPILALLCLALPAKAQSPNCGNVVDVEPNSGGFPAAGYTKLYLPHATTSGDVLIIVATGSSGDTLTGSDNGSNTWSTGKAETDTTNGQTMTILYAPITTPEANPWVELHHSVSDSWVYTAAFECGNIGVVDQSTGNFAASGTVTAGSKTPTVTGDLVIETFWDDWANPPVVTNVAAGSQSNITWKLIQADRADMWGGTQVGVYSSTAALNPTMTVTATTVGFVAAAVFFKAASSGTAHVDPTSGISINCEKTFWGSTRTEQWPCPSANNAMVVEWLGASGHDLTGVSDSASNTWTSTGAVTCATGAGGCTHGYYSKAATVGPTQTITLTDPNVDDSAKLYGISGASTSTFFDKTFTNNGDQTVAGNIDTGSVTPSTSNGLVISSLSVSNNTQFGVTGTGQLFVGCLWSAQSVNPGGCDENNGWAYYANPNTTAVDFTYTAWTAVAAGPWVVRDDVFEAPPAGATAIPRRRFGVF